MYRKNANPDRLSFVARQFSSLLNKIDGQMALVKLEQACGKEYQEEIRLLRNIVLGGTTQESSKGNKHFRTLSQLTAEAGSANTELIQQYVLFANRIRTIQNSYWPGFLSSMQYMAALCVIAFIITMIFYEFVIPGFSHLFSSNERELPEFTQLLFGQRFPLGTVAVAILILVLLIIASVARCMKTSMRNLTATPHFFRLVPGLRHLSKVYNLGLFVNFADMQIRSGVADKTALRVASQASGHGDSLSAEKLLQSDTTSFYDQSVVQLSTAARLGNLHSELSFQSSNLAHQLPSIFVKTRERMVLAINSLLYVVIGSLIVAMYLPIFQMGAVIS